MKDANELLNWFPCRTCQGIVYHGEEYPPMHFQTNVDEERWQVSAY